MHILLQFHVRFMVTRLKYAMTSHLISKLDRVYNASIKQQIWNKTKLHTWHMNWNYTPFAILKAVTFLFFIISRKVLETRP